MCCLLAVAALIGPRVAIIGWWLLDPVRWGATFAGANWIYAVLGWFFLPWTTLAWVFLSPRPFTLLEAVIIAIAFVADLSSYGGGYRTRPVRAA